jgi:hypothetical protein
MKFLGGVLIALVMSSSAHALTVTSCGDDTQDRKHPNLYWEKVGDYKLDSNYMSVRGLICAGVNQDFNQLERIHYRDDSGVKVGAARAELLKRDIPFLKYSDLPRSVRWLTRKMDSLTVRIIKEKKQENTTYQVSMKILRNPAKGFSKADIRDLRIDYKLNPSKSEGLATYKTETFDGIEVVVDGLNLDTVNFYDGQAKVQAVKVKSLARGNRVR